MKTDKSVLVITLRRSYRKPSAVSRAIERKLLKKANKAIRRNYKPHISRLQVIWGRGSPRRWRVIGEAAHWLNNRIRRGYELDNGAILDGFSLGPTIIPRSGIAAQKQ